MKSNVLIGLMTLACISAQAKSSILIVPNDGNVGSVIESLQAHGFQISSDSLCPSSAKMVRITSAAKNSRSLKISCLGDLGQAHAYAVPLSSMGSASGSPNPVSLEDSLRGASGDPNEFEGSATGDPNEFEGSATASPNPTPMEDSLRGASGDPNEFEGSATGASASSSHSSLAKFFGRLEAAARSAHAKIYKLIVGE